MTSTLIKTFGKVDWAIPLFKARSQKLLRPAFYQVEHHNTGHRADITMRLIYPGMRLVLTAPERYVLALSLHDDGGHCHGDWDGIKVGRVGGQGEDGCFCRQRPSTFHRHPMEPPHKPHDPHDDLQNYVHHSEKKIMHV